MSAANLLRMLHTLPALDDLNKEHITKYLQMDIYIVLGVDYDHI